MKKTICSLALVLLLLAGLAVPASADFKTETRDSVVVVNTLLDMDGGQYSFGWGTGFFVGETGADPQYLVTNYHVLADFFEYGAGSLVDINVNGTIMTGRSKIRVYYDSNDYEDAYIVDSNEEKDVAVLRLSSPTSKRRSLAVCSPTDDMVGSTVYAVGYPGLAENILAGATTSWGKSDASVTSGTLSRILTTSGTGQVNVQIDCVIRHGNSGGPVVNEEGAVLGIATWSVENNSSESINYAVSIDEVLPMLRVHDVAFTTAEELNAEAAPASGMTGADPAKAENNSGGLILIVAVLAAALTAAVAALIIVVRKKKKDTASSGQTSVIHTQTYRPMVRSLAAQHKGVAASCAGAQVVIGRNRNGCAIVFQKNTPGVSDIHCAVDWDPSSGCFTLTDLKSTYGTFLEDGQKLTPGVPYRLRPGARFYLGEAANMLSVGLE